MKQLLYLSAAVCLLASCQMNNGGKSMSNDSAARNEKMMQRFYDEVYNKQDLTKIDSLMGPNFIDHQDHNGPMSMDSMKASFKQWFTAFPNTHITVNFMVADSNMVVAEYTQTGTQSGPLMGMPASNKSENIHGVDIVKFDNNGKAIEHWGYYEQRAEAKQLGWMPSSSDSTMMNNNTKKETKKKK